MITQVDLPKSVAFVVADVARHVYAEQQALNRVGARYPVPRQKPTNSVGENQPLLPKRARFVRWSGNCPPEPLSHGNEVFALNDFNRQFFRLGANLRQLNIAFRNFAVNFVAPLITQIFGCRFIICSRFKQEINDDEPKSLILASCLLVKETARHHPADITFSLNGSEILVGFNSHDRTLNPNTSHFGHHWENFVAFWNGSAIIKACILKRKGVVRTWRLTGRNAKEYLGGSF